MHSPRSPLTHPLPSAAHPQQVDPLSIPSFDSRVIVGPVPLEHRIVRGNLLVNGMQGLGDNIHQRALLRVWVKYYNVFLYSSWVSIYHDLLPLGLKIVKPPATAQLRVQHKNICREIDRFFKGSLPNDRKVKTIWYRSNEVNALNGVLPAMCKIGGIDLRDADFRLPIHPDWAKAVQEVIDGWHVDKPIMIFRPLVARTDWGGCNARNPDFLAYAHLYEAIREKFFVISVADLEEKREWITGNPFQADLYLHRGELTFELMAALFKRATLVFASPGMAIPLAQSVGTPSVCVFGGFERSHSFDHGGKFAPYLSVGPIVQCGCWRHNHACPKEINVPLAQERLLGFVRDIL